MEDGESAITFIIATLGSMVPLMGICFKEEMEEVKSQRSRTEVLRKIEDAEVSEETGSNLQGLGQY